MSNNSVQHCFTTYTASQEIIIKGSDNVHLSDLHFKQAMSVDATCSADIEDNTNIDESVASTVQQEAESLSKGFSLSYTDSLTCIDLVTNLSIEVINTFQQELNTNVSINQVVLVEESTNVDISVVDMAFVGKSTMEGTAKVVTNTAAALTLTQFLEQHSSAKHKSSVLLLIIIAAGIFFTFFFYSVAADILLSPGFWIIMDSILVLIFGFLAFEYIPLWWPYETYINPYDTTDEDGNTVHHPGDSDEERAAKVSHNTTLLAWMASIFGVTLLIDIGLVFWSMKTKCMFCNPSDPTTKAKKEQKEAKKKVQAAAIEKETAKLLEASGLNK